jgi:cytidine deaminase
MTIKLQNARRQVSAQIRNHQVAAESFFYFSFSLFTYAFVDYWHRYRQKQRAMLMPSKIPQIAIQSDAYYLQKAHQFRLRLRKPPQSEFRVVCCLLLEDGTEMWGTNDEVSPSLSSAICAERAACLAYRSQQCSSNIHKVFVVTDAAQPLPPGTLCREYLYCHPATLPSTKVVMQAAPAASCDPPTSATTAASATSSTTWILTLEGLYPYPSCYIRKGLTSLQSSRLGQALEETMDVLLSHLVIPGLFGDQTRALLNAAHRASLRDDSHDQQLHPIQYGAAMAVLLLDEDRLEYWEAHQLKAYEYGGSQDPVCQLVARAVRRAKTDNAGDDHHDATKLTIKVLAVCQVDQYGIPHAPYGAARACLVEHGFGDAQVVVTFETQAGAADADPIAALGASDASSSPMGGGTAKQHWFVDDDDEDDEDDARVKTSFELPSLSVCAVQAKELAPYVPVIRHGGTANKTSSNGISNGVVGGSGFR